MAPEHATQLRAGDKRDHELESFEMMPASVVGSSVILEIRHPINLWDPGQYQRFKDERAQPFQDLVALIERRPRMRKW